MTDAGVIAGALAGFAAGIALGYFLGRRYRESRPRVYWALNGAAFVVGVVVDAVGISLGMPWLAVAGVGVLGGGMTGLRYGRGRMPLP